MQRRIVITLLLCGCFNLGLSLNNENSILVAKLPPNWKMVTNKKTADLTLLEYIPRHEKPGAHTQIIAQVILRNPDQTEQSFIAYHEKKIAAFVRLGCEIKPSPSFQFNNLKSPHEVFIYECAKNNTSGLDIIVNAKNTSIYDLMYEVRTAKLTQQDVSNAKTYLNDFKICYDNDLLCEK